MICGGVTGQPIYSAKEKDGDDGVPAFPGVPVRTWSWYEKRAMTVGGWGTLSQDSAVPQFDIVYMMKL